MYVVLIQAMLTPNDYSSFDVYRKATFFCASFIYANYASQAPVS